MFQIGAPVGVSLPSGSEISQAMFVWLNATTPTGSMQIPACFSYYGVLFLNVKSKYIMPQLLIMKPTQYVR